MIEGITILNQTPINIGVIPGWVFLILIMGCIFLFVMTNISDSNHWSNLTIIFGISTIICILTFIVLALWCPTEPTGRYKYECTIDKSVSITEVYEKYEVVEQRGDIWVLQDKE